MKKLIAAVAVIGMSLPVMAMAVEFQPIGTLGIGGAGVARNNGALTAYWNPAGGAFNEIPFAMHVGAGFGVRGSDGLAENVDRLSDIDFDSVNKFDGTNADSVGEMVKTITVLDDIGKRNGNIGLNANVPVAFSIKHMSFGVYGNFEGNIKPKADIMNILPTTASSAKVSVDDMYSAVSGTTYTAGGYFTPAQVTSLTTEFVNASTLNSSKAEQLAYAIEAQLSSSGIPANTTYDTLVTTLIPSLKAGAANTFDKNTTSVMTKAIAYYEVPLSYGYPFDFGSKGKLGIGATAKVIYGTVYQNQVLLVNRPDGDNISSRDMIDDVTKNSKSSVNFGIDLGALYKYDKWLSVGLVAKNLNSPKFDAPDYDAQIANSPGNTTKVAGEDVKLKPQVRAGIAVDPFDWLAVAVDLDLTENETVAPGTVVGSSVKSQNLGGGVELPRIRG